MTAKSASRTNTNRCADDALEDCLTTYCGLDEFTGDKEVMAFALLYIADKLDSIDTRLFHLVNQQGNKHE